MRPGIDYALTEAVRCKSRHEIGVEEALATCSSLYLRDTLAASGAAVIVVLGRLAARAVAAQLDVPPRQRVLERVVGDSPRTLVFLPHPNARTVRTLAHNVGAEELDRLRAIVSEALASSG